MDALIHEVIGRRVWDSRGRPTVEAEVRLSDGAVGRGIAPAGCSKGRHERAESRDGGPDHGGWGVVGALRSLVELGARLQGSPAAWQSNLDALIATAVDPEGAPLGANAQIALSVAVARATAVSQQRPLHAVVGPGSTLPMPHVQIFGGGAHAPGSIDIQEVMVIPIGARSYEEAISWCAEVHRCAGERLSATGRLRGVADQGGFWPAFVHNDGPLMETVTAIERAGLLPGEDVGLAVDVAATQLRDGEHYVLRRGNQVLDADELGELLLRWVERFPVVSIEDPFADDDAAAFARLTAEVGDRVQIVADDLLGTDPARIDAVASPPACNAAIIKPSQIGTLTGARAALSRAHAHGWATLLAGRSGDTEDVSVMHLAVGWGASQIKIGGFARSERTAKWNEGLRIADELGGGGPLTPQRHAPWGSQ